MSLSLKRAYKALKKNPNSSQEEIDFAKQAYLAAKQHKASNKRSRDKVQSMSTSSSSSTSTRACSTAVQLPQGAQYFTDENGDQHGPFPSAEIAVWESQNYNGGQCRMSYSTCITCYSAARNADAEEDRNWLRLMQGPHLCLSCAAGAAHIAEITSEEYKHSTCMYYSPFYYQMQKQHLKTKTK